MASFGVEYEEMDLAANCKANFLVASHHLVSRCESFPKWKTLYIIGCPKIRIENFSKVVFLVVIYLNMRKIFEQVNTF